MNKTTIGWTSLTWNAASGCVKVSAGCKHCFAETQAERYRGTKAFPNGFDLTLRPHKIDEPSRIKKPSLIFVNSMSDLFWDQIPDDYRDRVVDQMEANPQHEFQVLTKRADALLAYSKRRKLPPNFWAGVSVEDQDNAAKRIPVLLQVEAEIRFLSMEPLLGEVHLTPFISGRSAVIGGDGLQWVIVGGESGQHLSKDDNQRKRSLVFNTTEKPSEWIPRASRLPWVRNLRDTCALEAVPFFFKQWGGLRSKSGGNELDGDIWEELPRIPQEQQGELIK